MAVKFGENTLTNHKSILKAYDIFNYKRLETLSNDMNYIQFMMNNNLHIEFNQKTIYIHIDINSYNISK